MMAKRHLLPVIVREDLPEQRKLLVLIQENNTWEVARLRSHEAKRQDIKLEAEPCPTTLGCRGFAGEFLRYWARSVRPNG
jgi:predicted sugar kinase